MGGQAAESREGYCCRSCQCVLFLYGRFFRDILSSSFSSLSCSPSIVSSLVRVLTSSMAYCIALAAARKNRPAPSQSQWSWMRAAMLANVVKIALLLLPVQREQFKWNGDEY